MFIFCKKYFDIISKKKAAVEFWDKYTKQSYALLFAFMWVFVIYL